MSVLPEPKREPVYETILTSLSLQNCFFLSEKEESSNPRVVAVIKLVSFEVSYFPLEVGLPKSERGLDVHSTM